MTEALRGQIRRRVAAIGWLGRYDRRQLRPDLLAGCVAALAVPLGSAAIAGPGGARTVRRSACPHRVRGLRHLASTGGRTGLDRLGYVGIPCCRPPAGQCGAGSAVHDSGRTLVAAIVGYTRDRLPHAGQSAEACRRFILHHDPAAAAQPDGPHLTATNLPPHERSR